MSNQEQFLMIDKEIFNSWMFPKPEENNTMSSFEAYLSLCGLARWKKAQICLTKANLYQRELVASLSFLAVRFGWSKGRTQRMIDRWIKDGFISKRYENGNTIIKVKKYLILTGSDTANDTISDTISDTPNNEAKTGVKTSVSDTISDTTFDTVSDTTVIQQRYDGGNNKKKEKKEEKEKNKKEEGESVAKAPTPPIESNSIFNELIDYWNSEALEGIPRVTRLNKPRKNKIKARLKSNPKFCEDFKVVVQRFSKNINFYTGANDRNWVITFDWIIENESNYLKVLEGNYDDKGIDKISFRNGKEVKGNTVDEQYRETMEDFKKMGVI